MQRAQSRVRALFGDQKGRVDLAGGIVQRYDQVERRLAVQPFVPRSVLVQHHAPQWPTRPLAAMRPAPRCRCQKTLAVQKRLGPGVAPIKAVHPDQPLVEMLGGEPAIARPVQLGHPLGFRRRDPPRRLLAKPPVNQTGFSFFLKPQCTTGKERRVKRWEHEAIIDAMQRRLDQAPDIMRIRRQTVEHPFGTIKTWMGSTHFLTRTLKRVSTEMSLHVLAYNLKRVIAILGVGPLMAAIRA